MSVKTHVQIVSVDNKTGVMVLSEQTTLTEGVGKNASTSLLSAHTFRRAPRGSAQPAWELQATDGTYHAIDRDKVPDEVRQAWIMHSVPIRKREVVAKTKKVYVDITNMAHWREKMRQANFTLNS
jgi:hypothetical protein